MTRVFISYKRGAESDAAVAQEIHRALSYHFEVFIDESMAVDTSWAERITQKLNEADYFIPLLSEESVVSEMVIDEVERAHRRLKEEGRPLILPIRVAYQEPLGYPLSAYLNGINWMNWTGSEDTPALVETLLGVISGGGTPGPARGEVRPAPQEQAELSQPLPAAPPPLESPEGTMSPDSRFYIARRSDLVVLSAVERPGVTLVIKGPRQMGKSTLMSRVLRKAGELERKCVYLDFQLFDSEQLRDAGVFYRHFCSFLSYSLELPDRTEENWGLPLGNSQLCTRYVERYILGETGANLFVAMDEVDRVFAADYSSDFFAMLRAWHNNRATQSIWNRLNFAIVTSTEPYQFIQSLNQSPFNVGEVVELEDFSPAEVAELNLRYGRPFAEEEKDRLMRLLGGHPYLVRRALYLVASDLVTAPELFERAADDDGPFADHLRRYLVGLQGKRDLIEGLRRVIEDHKLDDMLVFFRLRGAGLVRRDGRNVTPRCQLYEQFFRERLDE